MIMNPISLDNKGSWRILKDFNCSATMLRELGLIIYNTIYNTMFNENIIHHVPFGLEDKAS